MAPKTRIRASTLVRRWKTAGQRKEALRKKLQKLEYTLQRISQLLHGFDDTHLRPRGATAANRKNPAALPIRASIVKRPVGRARPAQRALALRAAGKPDEEIIGKGATEEALAHDRDGPTDGPSRAMSKGGGFSPINITGAHPYYMAWEAVLRRRQWGETTAVRAQRDRQSQPQTLLALLSAYLALQPFELQHALESNMVLSGYRLLAERLLFIEKELQPLHLQILVDFLPGLFPAGFMATHTHRPGHAILFTNLTPPALAPLAYRPSTPCVHLKGGADAIGSLVIWGPAAFAVQTTTLQNEEVMRYQML